MLLLFILNIKYWTSEENPECGRGHTCVSRDKMAKQWRAKIKNNLTS